MPIIKSVDVNNKIKNYNPDIELNKVHQIFKSVDVKGPVYIRFVVENSIRNTKPIDVYWLFNDFTEQNHNYRLVTSKFKEINK